MDLIYDRNIRPNTVEYQQGILTRVSDDTRTARRRVEGVRNRMIVAYKLPEAVMMRRLRNRLNSISRSSSK